MVNIYRCLNADPCNFLQMLVGLSSCSQEWSLQTFLGGAQQARFPQPE